MAYEVCEEVGAGRGLEVFCNGCALVKELHSVFFSLVVCVFRVEYREKFVEERRVGLEVLDDINLVEEY